MSSNDRVGISVRQPVDRGERDGVAKKCCSALGVTMPMVVDEMDDRVGHAYSGMPDRLYLVDRDGRVAYKGGRGPFGFNVREMEQALAMLLLDEQARDAKPAPKQGRVPLMKEEEAWKRLPELEKGERGPLPSWALALADALPRTTAGMIELDWVQQTRSPLGPKLRAKMRWVAARANRCAYAEAYAAADFRRAGGTEAELKALAGDRAGWPAEERDALTFARKLTVAADTVTDEEVAALIKRHGEKHVVAMVALLAYANFQDRLILALDLPLEPGGPLPPLEVRFKKGGPAPEVPARKTPEKVAGKEPAARVDDPEWAGLDFAALQKQMEGQRARPARIRVPTWEEVKLGLPPEYPANRPSRIKWSLVCMGYQPELSGAWLTTMRTFGAESKQDRVFEESLFWVVTRSLSCFY
jgi:alkylhydroperoxidase family enzyme